MNPDRCIFCEKDNSEIHTIIAQSELAYARWDNYPASLGHAEIIPMRHVESYFELTTDEVVAMHGLAQRTREVIMRQYRPDGFTIGVNDGEAAGRTVHHVHLHLIPRYIGDVANPRGGIRHVIPGKGDY